MTAPTLVLASASPRRLDLCRLAGLDPIVRPCDIDESVALGDPPLATVVRLARAKARGIERASGEVVLAADTVVVAAGRILGKPTDDADAAEMLTALSGRVHEVITGVTVVDADGAAEVVVRTQVQLTDLSPQRIGAYIDTGEGRDKAGAYAIQGRGAALVRRIEGSWTNVVGLPLVETLELLADAHVHPTSGGLLEP